MVRLKAKTDDNHQYIVSIFRSLGCAVADLSQIGGGIPDLLVCINGHNVLVEVKDGKKPPSKRKLTIDEQKFFDNWPGPCHIIEDFDDVKLLLIQYRKKG